MGATKDCYIHLELAGISLPYYLLPHQMNWVDDETVLTSNWCEFSAQAGSLECDETTATDRQTAKCHARIYTIKQIFIKFIWWNYEQFLTAIFVWFQLHGLKTNEASILRSTWGTNKQTIPVLQLLNVSSLRNMLLCLTSIGWLTTRRSNTCFRVDVVQLLPSRSVSEKFCLTFKGSAGRGCLFLPCWVCVPGKGCRSCLRWRDIASGGKRPRPLERPWCPTHKGCRSRVQLILITNICIPANIWSIESGIIPNVTSRNVLVFSLNNFHRLPLSLVLRICPCPVLISFSLSLTDRHNW